MRPSSCEQVTGTPGSSSARIAAARCAMRVARALGDAAVRSKLEGFGHTVPVPAENTIASVKQHIDSFHDTYGALARHFSPQQVMDIALTVGLSNMINRFHATFRTDLDADTIRDAEAGDAVAGACPIPRPRPPGA